ncbi:LysR family transcriptional regulator [Streptomyces sp. NPDC012461]|uniref:LysR family transcriptional regulator n=2 Tax=unclassified Streptomyces TaxID=2593676 RepID=A0A6G3QSG6_9ACTN|nr:MULTISPECIES: LysR family transcriptional regulator [unclassified Streptomyces]MBM7089024.1 LysR family transcriptional regulator [Streptomyces sp. S12]NEA86443.1 LysR family transcriptional regulator [Streptomyces sp. SID14436]NEC79611.1 LysR family transcriptional regulator [Streptomyces sp. SID7958]NED18853.1 LysR family transcriptional regulator [Streptomyces sp. SID9913]
MIDIYETEFRKADLNLLVVFSALLRERSVTRAAAALHLSQGATSAALGRLRTLFGDELFTRTRGGVEPTPRALELARRVEPALSLIHGAVTDRDRFDPATARRTFTLGMSDDLEAALLPRLLTATAALPGVRIAVRQTTRNTVGGMIDRGEIDLGVAAAPAHGADHRSRDLFESGYTCLFAPRLLPLRTPLGLDDYLSHPHLLISYDGRRGIVDDLLEARGLTRRVIASTTHFAGAALQLPTLAALATLPTHAATVYARALGLAASPPPLPMPTYTVSAIWHGTLTDDPGLRWLRGLVEEAAREHRRS